MAYDKDGFYIPGTGEWQVEQPQTDRRVQASGGVPGLPGLQLGQTSAGNVLRMGSDDDARRHLSDVDAHSSWAALTEWWIGPAAEPPTHLARSDGKTLLYPGSVNSIVGESGSGKTWLALLALQQAGGGVFIDMESRGPAVADRIIPIGLLPAAVTYLRPREPLKLDRTIYDLLDALQALPGPSLVILDGFNAFLELQGLDYTSTPDVTFAFREFLEPIADMGHALTLVDHTPHAQPGVKVRAIGSQAKKATLTGSSLNVKMTEPFGRGRRGVAYVTVLKDKAGYVDALIQDDDPRKTVGQFILDARQPSYIAELNAMSFATQEMRVQDAEATIRKIEGWEGMSMRAIVAAYRGAGGALKNDDLRGLIKAMKPEGSE